MMTPIEVQTPHRGRLFNVEALSWTDDQGRAVQREVVRHPGAVLILPWLDADRLVLVRNHRVAVGDWLWELPAGTLESGEDPRDAARRELEEETGYAAARMEPLCEFFTSPGFCDERMRVFVAHELSFVGQRLEVHEQLEAHEVTRAELERMIDAGELVDGKTLAALFMWERASRGGAA